MNSSKRKRDDTSSEDEGKHLKKKVHKRSDSVINKKVNRKKQSHHLSSSDEERFDQPVKPKHKKRKKQSHHLSSSDEERFDQSVKPKLKKHKSKGNTDSETDKVSNENSQIESEDFYRIQSVPKSNTNKNLSKQTNNGHNSDKSDSSSSETKEVLHSVHPKSSRSVYENGCGSDLSDISEHEPNSQDKDDVGKSDSVQVSASSKLITNQLVDQLYREHNFTEEDEKVISKYSSLLNEKVLEENNVWILQCPSNVDCSSLVNQSLNFNGNCLLDAGERKYEAYSHRSNQNSFVTLAVPNHRNSLRLCRIPIAGHIILEETVKITNKNRINIPESPPCVKFPENLRVRHPLLGTDYDNQPKTIARIGLSTKKKKKHSKTDNDESGVDTSLMSSSSIECSKKKKKKKRISSSEDLTVSSNIDEHVEGFCESSRAKKKKHRDKDS